MSIGFLTAFRAQDTGGAEHFVGGLELGYLDQAEDCGRSDGLGQEQGRSRELLHEAACNSKHGAHWQGQRQTAVSDALDPDSMRDRPHSKTAYQ